MKFSRQSTKRQIEQGEQFEPLFNADGLIVCITQSAASGEVLMVAFMNEEALSRTLESGIMHYWSRSRAELWKKGQTSGQIQRLVDLRTDCDQDALLARVDVEGDGGACHVGHRSCFYRQISRDKTTGTRLEMLKDP